MSTASTRRAARQSTLHALQSQPFNPSSDAHTFRDLLIFEERLKQNAARLMRRKKKYQTLLLLLCSAIAFLSFHVFLRPKEYVPLQYLNTGLLFFLSTTLVLFFAGGMYSERIVAANKFVPQANRSLRSFNMHLNVRQAPRRSILSRLFGSSSRSSPPNSQPASVLPSPTTSHGTVSAAQASNNGSTAPALRRLAISAIPPSSNPRGEIIFSSKVSPAFRDGYERYRAAFERRRMEKLRERKGTGWAFWGWFGGGGNKGAAVAGQQGSQIQVGTQTRGKSASAASSPQIGTVALQEREKKGGATGGGARGAGQGAQTSTGTTGSGKRRSRAGTNGSIASLASVGSSGYASSDAGVGARGESAGEPTQGNATGNASASTGERTQASPGKKGAKGSKKLSPTSGAVGETRTEGGASATGKDDASAARTGDELGLRIDTTPPPAVHDDLKAGEEGAWEGLASEGGAEGEGGHREEEPRRGRRRETSVPLGWSISSSPSPPAGVGGVSEDDAKGQEVATQEEAQSSQSQQEVPNLSASRSAAGGIGGGV